MLESTANAGKGQKDATLAYALLRITLGLNICAHGLVRWHGGIGSFAKSMVAMFAKAPLPAWLVHAFGFALPPLETFIGAAILFGFHTRRALVLGMLLMLVLMFGSTLLENWQVVGVQLIYSAVYAALLAAIQFDLWTVQAVSPWIKKRRP